MAETVELWSREGQTMSDWWTDDILVTKRQDGSFSLQARKHGDGRFWLRSGIQRIRTPKHFANAVANCWETLGVDLAGSDVNSVVPNLKRLDAAFGERLRDYLSDHEERRR